MSRRPAQENIDDCLLCRGSAVDEKLERVEVWSDRLWRLTTSLSAEVLGFSYLEPCRHITDVTAINGEEAATLGSTLSRVTRILREEAGAEQVYIYIFGGGIPHLHIHLAPHKLGDALSAQMIKGGLVVEKMASGTERLVSKEFPILPLDDQLVLVERLRRRFSQA